VIGVDVQRIRRALGLRAEPPARPCPRTTRAATGCHATRWRRFEALMRRELERAQIERTGNLPPARPLGELDPRAAVRAAGRPGGRAPRRHTAAPAAGHAGDADARAPPPRPRRRTPNDASFAADRRRARRAEVPPAPAQTTERSTCCATSPRASPRPRLFSSRCCTRCTTRFERCARSCSSSASPRSTDIFEHERNFKAVSERIGFRRRRRRHLRLTPTTGASGRSSSCRSRTTCTPRATVIVLGDARTNGRDPRADIFAQIAARAGRTFLAEPRAAPVLELRDSVIAAYEEYCTAFECWTTAQLEDFVRALTRPVVSA